MWLKCSSLEKRVWQSNSSEVVCSQILPTSILKNVIEMFFARKNMYDNHRYVRWYCKWDREMSFELAKWPCLLAHSGVQLTATDTQKLCKFNRLQVYQPTEQASIVRWPSLSSWSFSTCLFSPKFWGWLVIFSQNLGMVGCSTNIFQMGGSTTNQITVEHCWMMTASRFPCQGKGDAGLKWGRGWCGSALPTDCRKPGNWQRVQTERVSYAHSYA